MRIRRFLKKNWHHFYKMFELFKKKKNIVCLLNKCFLYSKLIINHRFLNNFHQNMDFFQEYKNPLNLNICHLFQWFV